MLMSEHTIIVDGNNHRLARTFSNLPVIFKADPEEPHSLIFMSQLLFADPKGITPILRSDYHDWRDAFQDGDCMVMIEKPPEETLTILSAKNLKVLRPQNSSSSLICFRKKLKKEVERLCKVWEEKTKARRGGEEPEGLHMDIWKANRRGTLREEFLERGFFTHPSEAPFWPSDYPDNYFLFISGIPIG